jgi:hypothetical protein
VLGRGTECKEFANFKSDSIKEDRKEIRQKKNTRRNWTVRQLYGHGKGRSPSDREKK